MPDTKPSDGVGEEAKLIYNGYEVRQVEIITTDDRRIFVGTDQSAEYPSELYYVKQSAKEI